jgi:parvulin-like peptidyl-prolyl isomerase
MRIVREPLAQFLGLGTLMFGAYAWLAGDAGTDRRIVIDESRIEFLRMQFRATWNREATPEELRGLVDGAVRDEMLYREGEALGLGRDDPVVKRRIRQKYEVLAEELLAEAAPTNADLDAYLAANPERYRQPAVVGFSQVLVAASDSGDGAPDAADRIRQALERGADPSTLGLRTLLPPREEGVDLERVGRDYGQAFAEALERLPTGSWQGPVTSAYGLHLVRIEQREPGRLPALEEVRFQVARDFEDARRKRALDVKLAELGEKYDVIVEAAPPANAP